MEAENEAPIEFIDSIRYEYFKQLNRENQRKTLNPRLEEAVRKSAALCYRLKVDPVVYVAAQIKYCNRPEFYPTDLYTSKSEENVAKYTSIVNRSGTYKGSWEMQKRYLATAIKNTSRTVEEILLDHNVNFDAWFRILITKEPIPSVINKWGYNASQELKSQDLKSFLNSLELTDHVKFDFSRIPEYW